MQGIGFTQPNHFGQFRIDKDGPIFWLNQPDLINTDGKIFFQLVLNLFPAVIGRDNFDDYFRCNF